MDVSSGSKDLLCSLCGKKFSSVKLLNRHNKRMHNTAPFHNSLKCFIVCPLCVEQVKFRSHEDLRTHLKSNHKISVQLLTFEFSSNEKLEEWMKLEKIKTMYKVSTTGKHSTECKKITYDCKRSDNRGYQPNYQKRKEKSGGTIKIKGVCPSRLFCYMYDNGTISVNYWKTHVGHEEKELRKTSLFNEENIVVKKLQSGIPSSRILEDTKIMSSAEIETNNLLNRKDVTYLARKFKIDRKRNRNELVAVALKTPERNSSGEHVAFSIKLEAANNLEENTVVKSQCEKEKGECLVEKKDETETYRNLDAQEKNRRKIQIDHLANWISGLSGAAFNVFMKDIQGSIKKVDKLEKTRSTKTKLDKEGYFWLE